jgi:hypothetical protein
MTSATQIQQHFHFLNAPPNVIQYELILNANGDRWTDIDVIYNPNPTPAQVTLPGGRWTIVAKGGRAGVQSLGHAIGQTSVPPISAEVLYGGQVGASVDPTGNTGGPKKMVSVTFKVRVPSNTPAGDTVFIPGDVDQLGPWDPAKQPMQNAGSDVWTVTLQIPDGTHLQYKYTRGSWATVESWGSIIGTVNRHVMISYGTDGTQLVDDTATDWGKPGPDDHRGVQKWVDLPVPASP